MKAISTVIIWADESRKEKIANDIGLLCKTLIKDFRYDEEIDIENSQIDIVIIDLDQSEEKKVLPIVTDIIEKIKEKDPLTVSMITGKYSTKAKKAFKESVDILSGITPTKIKNDYRSCLDLLVENKYKLNYFLTDFFAPHLLGDLERKGFELVLNDTYEREAYKTDFLQLWRSFVFFSPLLTPKNRDLLKNAIHTYEERELNQDEKDAIINEFFFQFNSLPSLGNFNERRLYYIERSVIANIWESVINFARDVDNSLLFGCSKSANYVRLKLMIHKGYPLKKISKNTDIFKTLSMIVPYGDVVILSNGERLVIGTDPLISKIGELDDSEVEDDTLIFYFYIRVILPHRRHRGLKRY